jgi:hypothetical protein
MSDDDDDLFSYHARSSDPDTSHEAVPHNISQQAWRVLHAYRSGLALLDEHAYELVGMDGHQRCSDLRRWKFIERCGRGRTAKGKAGYLCRITPAGHAFLTAGGGEPIPMGPAPKPDANEVAFSFDYAYDDDEH